MVVKISNMSELSQHSMSGSPSNQLTSTRRLNRCLEDSRKLRRRRKEGYTLTYVDDFVDDLLTKDRSCATSLWKLPARMHLEDLDLLEDRMSPLQAELDAMDDEEDDGDMVEPTDTNGLHSNTDEDMDDSGA